ncbi:hemocytin isoform X2 [Bombus pyrosoma]|uniref:hemocytin isoform X2 n=1 Tax=Bombus pyrosoma TaxID=396416 RepID=UPI001CB88FC1|nr:hemocytin isoform X2 [Bombus pyrosoma]
MMLWKAFLNIAIITTISNQLTIEDNLSQSSAITDATISLNGSPKHVYESMKSTKSKRKLPIFPGGCNKKPDPPIHGEIICSIDSGCIATCKRDYEFPNGVTRLAITCMNEEWHIYGTDWDSIPHCEPICIPECLNNGICVAPHQCNCPEDFTGPQCQFENKPCLNFPAPILNAHKKCNSQSCTISCMKNFTFPDGTSVTNLMCKNGNWKPTREDWVSIPDCEPVCDPPCQNGGNCLPSNFCQCPQAFKGPQCQYSSDNCNGEKMGFNGGFSCTSVDDTYSCIIRCPDGIEFEFPSASAYICNYETGVFSPQPIPQCNYGDNMNIISLGTTYNSYVKETNHTWTYQDTFKSHTKQLPLFQGNYGLTQHYSNHESNMVTNTMIFNPSENNLLFIEEKKPIPKTCFTWGGVHYKTFDDNVFSFDSGCSHILVQEAQNRLFTVTVDNSPTCKNQDCFRIIRIFIQDKEYILLRNKDGVPEFRTRRHQLPIPAQLSALRAEMSAHFIVITLDSLGIQLKWDGALMLQVEALENMWNKTTGLCGNMNGDKSDDLISKNGEHTKSVASFATSWRTENIGEMCDEYPNTKHSCESDSLITKEAIEFCTKLFSDRRFKACASTLNIPELQTACIWDYCSCLDSDRKRCACDTMNVYVRQCAHKKVVSLSGWRNDDICPMTCSGGRIYLPCGPKIESSCWTEEEEKPNTKDCEEGCFCPEGTVAYEGRCIQSDECPCRLRGKLFQPGKSVQKDCNTCTCFSGKWICTQAKCSARCAVMGDPHYITFDGRHYDFMGKCKYYLMKGDDYSIEGENVPCSGAISENMGHVPSEAPSCTKTITINYKDISMKLKQHREVLINGDDLTVFPTLIHGIRIRIASSIFLIVQLPNGLEIWWDGISRVYINAPPEFHGNTRGLCGTFSENQKDDFITPEGDIENTAIAFANKWKCDEFCPNVADKELDHPCDLDPQKRATAKQYCSYLFSDIFAGCHWHVDPDTFYRDCLFDMCSCKVELESCLCPMLAAYAKDCAAAGIKLLWHQNIEECKIHCPGNQVYQICGNSCTRSCGDISSYQDCKQECVEGCNCPEGETLDIHGECIPIGQCPCIYGGLEFSPGHKEVRPGNKALELCTCAGGIWSCREATPNEITEYPATKDLLASCVASNNQEVTDCVPAEPRTCHNMYKPVQKPSICKSGCICKPGYVLDKPDGICIKEESCSCHHGSQSYEEASIIQNDCNTCKCINGTWKCTDRTCAGVCSAWGNSHYKTFDGRLYDFEGICDYVFVKGSLSQEDCFDVSIQNVPCGTTGTSCSKSITLTIGSGQNSERIVLTRGKELPADNFKRISMREAGLFVFIDVPDMGLTVQWDKGTRVYVRLEPSWKGRTKGLCGDYNDNSKDDFKTPSGGISEVSANLFGDSWKKNEFCPEPKDVLDPCVQHPERNLWAVQKCGILKSPVFHPCHSEVEVESYMRNCIYDTCSCDTGGDCECLCTALAAYAQECNAKGVPIKWRSQELCPIQCDEKCSSYSPCVTTCPRETCDNLITLKDKAHLCSQDTCVEGCSVKSCPQNQVYSNDSYTECVPKETCKTPCTEINGVIYYEGDSVKNENCQMCYCSRGKVLCKGEPCTITAPSTIPLEEPQKCVDGWTAWINQDPAIKGKKFKDIEPLPSTLELANKGSAICNKNQMVDIKCRSVNDYLTPKETGLDVECSLERGLYCQSQPGLPCIDFEISVLCQCSATTAGGSEIPSTTEKPTYKECNMEHPYESHPTNCHLFYQCTPGLSGNEFVEKSCGENMFYNPQIQVCDWPANVISVRPECSMKQTMPNRTEWTTDNKTKYKSTTSTTLEKNIITTKVCKEGETWSDCAIKCNKVCDYYKHTLIKEGKCDGISDCVPGCIPLDKPQCSSNEFWRDALTCVDESDCTCKSHNGRPVISGAILKESECEICQCINNYYTCDKSLCVSATNKVTTDKPITQPPTEATTLPTTPLTEAFTIIIPSTVSPPAYCVSNNFIPLVQYLNDQVSFNASSIKSSEFQPENALLNGNTKFWEPEYTTTDQWLDIKFQNPEPIYGIIIQGSTMENKFVTSYKVLFSENGHSFSYVMDDRKEPQVFRGPVDQFKSVEQKFYEPIEAKIVRINPLSWHNGIAMKVELLGCQEMVSTIIPVTGSVPITTTMITEKIIIPVCDDPMGLDNGLIFPEQVSVSSSSTDLLPNLKLSSPSIWHPKLDNPYQFVKIDFLEPRNLTGIATKGSEDTWTTVYKVFYSNDDYQWNPVMDENGLEREFLGNFDSDTVKKNYFDKPLNARYLKVQPIKWHKQIGLKLEVLGCFLPYTTIKTTTEKLELTPTTVQTLEKCNVCKGVPFEDQVNCRCTESLWWNGDTCVTQQECPCVVEHITYNVGVIYMGENCQECTCTLGGISFCQPMKCKPCQEPDMRPVVNELCNCICKPCPSGTRHCPTSDVCIDENSWCNGIQDCPDDEKNCSQTTVKHEETTTVKIESTTVTPTSVSPIVCQEPVCPPGYKIVLKTPTKWQHYLRSHMGKGVKSSSMNSLRTKGLRKSFRKSMHHDSKHTDNENIKSETECAQFTCVPIILSIFNQAVPQTCPKVSCPPGYTVVYEKMSMYKLQKCPKYTCKPPPPIEAVCNVTGRTFNTFDKLEYKYDICNHILARDMFANKWYITLEKQCDSHTGQCIKILAVILDADVVLLYPADMHVDINDYSFTQKQIARISNNFPSFKIASIGDITYLLSNNYGFWVIWDRNSNVKIGISTKWARQVDGLCGYFDGYSMNDKELPDGSQARSTVEFGNSWAMEGVPECDPQVCPHDLQAESWEICNIVKDTSLAECSKTVDLEKFVSSCMESTCSCLRSNFTYNDCRCRLLTNFITECQASDPTIDLSIWRSTHDCPTSCTPPFVHKDCFRNKCETSCENLQQIDPCPVMQGVCFSGCFCPEGTVRNGDECVPPTHCKDCICEWLGNSKFITFDRKNVKFDGNCTYILSRDIIENTKGNEGHTYQVLVSNRICDTGICTEAIIVLYQDHVIKIKEGVPTQEFEVELNGSKVYGFPFNTSWLTLEQTPSEKLLLLIPSIQLEIISYQPNFAFSLTVPSHIFGGAIEGLCGNCNAEAEDDLKQQDGQVADNMQDFGTSWLVTESPSGVNIDTNTCISINQSKCVLSPTDQATCRKLLDTMDFDVCHNLVDPMPYLMACQDSMCSGGSYCDSFEAYSRKCQQMGVCLIWRSSEMCPYFCPPHLVYQPCGFTCKETCDTINEINSTACSKNYEEGCFCPPNFVFHNDTCIPKEKCLLCDEEGHVEGDIWFPDVCTRCTCNRKSINCEKTECPAIDTICEENMAPVVVNRTEESCCTKYVCIPKTVTTVAPFCIEEPQIPECGYGQTVKVSVDSDGCKKYICECVPLSECPILNEVALEVEELEPGFVQVTNTSGCCPRSMTICDSKTCPAAPSCPEYHELKSDVKWDACCATYKCVPPKDLCLYNVESESKIEMSEHIVAKKLGEKWMDGKCTSCICEFSETGPTPKCFTTECLKAVDHPDISDFVVEEVLVEDKCCPNFERTACKDGDEIYNTGDVWQPNPEDSCTLIKCIKDENGVQKQVKVQECITTCDPGFEYQPTDNRSTTCCGRCIPVACIVNNKVINVGEEWLSPDFCTKYTCQSNNESIYVESLTQKCPEMDAREEAEFEIEKQYIAGQCCPQFIKTGCRYNGTTYKPGEKWKLLDDKCATEFCVLNDVVTKYKDIEVCNKNCTLGWIYEMNEAECCGKCRQAYCVVGDTLYEPGATWFSTDNCTSFTCMNQGEQLVISSSSLVCPDITDCPVTSIYTQNCCKMCNLTSYNQKVDSCAAEVLELQNTIGMFNIKHRGHGICKNLEPIDGVTECRGKCESTTYFDTENWNQVANCKCCQPTEYKSLVVELTCENYRTFKKQVAVPVSCTCSACTSARSGYKGRKGGVKS